MEYSQISSYGEMFFTMFRLGFIVEFSVLQIYKWFNVSPVSNSIMLNFLPQPFTLVNWLFECLIYLINIMTSNTKAKYEALMAQMKGH